MGFFVTNDYEIIDPEDGFKMLSPENQDSLLFDALDLYEKHMGRALQDDFPNAVIKDVDLTKVLGAVYT